MFYVYYIRIILLFLLFFFNDTATTEIYTLSLHDALPISRISFTVCFDASDARKGPSPLAVKDRFTRSEEHTSELQSHSDLVCRLLLEKKKNKSLDYNFMSFRDVTIHKSVDTRQSVSSDDG